MNKEIMIESSKYFVFIPLVVLFLTFGLLINLILFCYHYAKSYSKSKRIDYFHTNNVLIVWGNINARKPKQFNILLSSYCVSSINADCTVLRSLNGAKYGKI